MPGLNCNFRIEDVQECDNMLDPFESDEADNDSLNDDALTLEDSEYSNRTWDYNGSLSSEESASSDEESSDDQSEQSNDKVSNSGRVDDFDVDAVSQELYKMDSEQCELAQNLIAAILHEGVMGRLTPSTVLKGLITDLTSEENCPVLPIPTTPDSRAMMFNYYIKLVPTVIEKADGHVLHTNQFSVTKFEKHLSLAEGDGGMPGIFFSYELSPLMVKRTQHTKSIGHLIMTLLSYVSGVYIAALLIDSFVHRTVKYLRKWEIGKQS